MSRAKRTRERWKTSEKDDENLKNKKPNRTQPSSGHIGKSSDKKPRHGRGLSGGERRKNWNGERNRLIAMQKGARKSAKAVSSDISGRFRRLSPRRAEKPKSALK